MCQPCQELTGGRTLTTSRRLLRKVQTCSHGFAVGSDQCVRLERKAWQVPRRAGAGGAPTWSHVGTRMVKMQRSMHWGSSADSILLEWAISLNTISGSYHSAWRLSPADLTTAQWWPPRVADHHLAAATLSGSPFNHSTCSSSPPHVAPTLT